MADDSSTVVVVDDDDTLRAILVDLLERRTGYRVWSFSAGDTALEQLHQQPLVAVLDVDMVPMSGLDLARQLRLRWRGLPIVFLTACASEHRAMLRCVQPSAVLEKPSGVNTLVQTVQAAAANPATERSKTG